MDRQPTVYLLQEPTSDKDLSSALVYGRIYPIIGSNEQPAKDIPRTMNKLAVALRNYDPSCDSICFAGGDPMVELLAGIVLERLGFEEVIHLVWNRERADNGIRTGHGCYMPKRINLLSADPENFISPEG